MVIMNDLKIHIEYEQLIDYINKRASVETQNKITLWLEEDIKNQYLLNELKAYYERKVDLKELEFDTELALKKLNIRIHKRRIISMYKIAAVVLLIISFSFIGEILFNRNKIEKIIIANNSLEIKKVILPDSSIVWLNTNSQISYNKLLNGETRKIEMKGHAFFKVKRNPKKPFEVYLEDVYIKVLGTSFDVCESSVNVQLKVNTGKVLFAEKRNRNNNLTLTKNTGAIYTKKLNEIKQTKILDRNYSSYYTGIISFHESPIKDVCQFLSKFYKKEINLKNNQDSTKLLTTVIDNLSLEDVKSTIEFALDIKLEIK